MRTLLLLGLAVKAASLPNRNVLPIEGRHQWPDRDGYCGSNSIQMNALFFGSWISQGVVRGAVGEGNCGGGGVQNEVLHTNIECALKQLKLRYDAWDYKSATPQSTRYLTWLKSHLVLSHPLVMFIFCKGDSHSAHGDEAGYGHYDHIEPVVGLLSNHSIDPASPEASTYYGDDVLVHYSDWSQQAFYRRFDTMADSTSMKGNCAHVVPFGGGPNEAYPCIPEDVDYGYAMIGRVDPLNASLPTVLAVDQWTEPDIVEGKSPAMLTGTLTVSGLVHGRRYALLRFDDYRTVPTNSSFIDAPYTSRYDFVANATRLVYTDPRKIVSSSSVYYFTVDADH